MNTRVFTPLLSLAAIFLVAGGCADAQKRSYAVEVKNESRMPVTVWLTKDGPVYEDKWKSPEDLAIETRRAGEMIAGVVVPPGKTASVGPLEGKFAPYSNAILRVYVGQHNFSELLAISKGAPDRRDLELTQGRNSFQVVDRNGIMLVERTGAPMSMSTDAPK
ncbi:hypothetical protein BH09PLA1_BH09PLA1_24620 [soil metagenome]